VQCYGRYRDCYAKVKMAWNIIEEFITTLAKSQPGTSVAKEGGVALIAGVHPFSRMHHHVCTCIWCLLQKEDFHR
jgi:hypothetical protein